MDRAAALPVEVRSVVELWIQNVDDALRDDVEGIYLVGSLALDAYQPGRSDIDLLVTLRDRPSDAALGDLRAHQRRRYRHDLVSALPTRWPLTCNTTYVVRSDLSRPATEARPVASHVSGRFEVGRGFDANPVQWRTLARSGIALRGPEPAQLDVHDDPALLRAWTVDNLHQYWVPWAASVRRPGLAAVRASFRQLGVAWAVLGTARQHRTITTGEVVSKAAAGEYALDAFGERWHPVVREALEYWDHSAGTSPFGFSPRGRFAAADFVDMVAGEVEANPP